ASTIVRPSPTSIPTNVHAGRRPKRTLAPRKTAKKSTSGSPSRAAPPPGTRNATERAPKTPACPSAIFCGGPRQTEHACTQGISSATSTTHETASKKPRNHHPRNVTANSLQKFDATGTSSFEKATARTARESPNGSSRRLSQSGSASQTRRKLSGITTRASSQIDGQSENPPTCGASSYHPISAARTASRAAARTTTRRSA